MESIAKFTIHRNVLRAANLLTDTEKKPGALGGVLVGQEGESVTVTATNGFALFRCLQAGKIHEGTIPEEGIMVPTLEIMEKFPGKRGNTQDFFDYRTAAGRDEPLLTIVQSVDINPNPVGIHEIDVISPNIFPDSSEVIRKGIMGVEDGGEEHELEVGIDLMALCFEAVQVFQGGKRKFKVKDQGVRTDRSLDISFAGKRKPFVMKARNAQEQKALIVVMPLLGNP